MKRVYLILLPFVFLTSLYSTQSSAQNWAGILKPTYGSGACSLNPSGSPAACAIDWSQSGIPGGIPSGSWSQSGSTITSTGSDQTSQIQTALNSCGTNHYVLLAAGTFQIGSQVVIPSNCELRGSGADQTILNTTGSANAPIDLGTTNTSPPGGSPLSNKSSISGASAGSTSLNLSSTSGMSVGGYLVISETNPSWVTATGSEGTCGWCDGGWSTTGQYARGQIVEITGISGNTVTISPGLYSAYTQSPFAVYFSAVAKYAGVRGVQVRQNNTGYTDGFFMGRCAYCWITESEGNYADGNFFEISWGYRDQVESNYFSNAFKHSSGVDSDGFINFKTSASLVVNNIIERGHNGLMLNWGAAGNVLAYNYTHGGYDSGGTNWTFDGILMHGAHPQFNLIEGNVSVKYNPDNIWGSSSHNTNLRNWFYGTATVCDPLATTRTTVTCSSPVNSFQVAYAEAINALSWYDNFIGDIAGSATQQSLLAYGTGTMTHLGIATWPTSIAFDFGTENFGFGYDAHADDGSTSGDSGTAYSTSTIYNSYTNATSKTNCLSGGSSSSCSTPLPASFYLMSKPSWWNSNVQWPAIGPDVTGGSGPGGHTSLTSSNPAQYCYRVVMGGKEGGDGSPLHFSPGSCYSGSSTTSSGALQAPTGLTATVTQ